MTTIAWDGTTLAGDTLGVDYNLKRYAAKTWRLTDGRLYGGSGDYASVLAVKDWLEAEQPADKKPELDDFAAMVINNQGQCFVLESRLIFLPITEKFHAVGSGRDFAIAAMYLGADAVRAVEVAAVFDVYTDGAIQELSLFLA